MHPELQGIIDVMDEQYEYSIHAFEEDFIKKTIHKRMTELSINEWTHYQEYLIKHSWESAFFYNALLIQFSSFYRDKLSFLLFESVMLPKLIREKTYGDTIRIWSAACSTGEEIYSLAMILSERFAVNEKQLKVNIFATDIDVQVVESAKKGLYDVTKIQNVPYGLLEKYFTKKGLSYEVIPEIRNKIVFAVHDLLSSNRMTPAESIYGNFDMIMCNNVLFYYNEATQIKIMNNIKKSLAPNGYIVTDGVSSETFKNRFNLRCLQLESSVFQLKNQ